MMDKNKMSDEKPNTKVDISDKVVGEIELPKLDVNSFLGKDSKIVACETHKGSFGFYVKVLSDKLGEHAGNDVTASRIFSLIETEDGKIAWGSESKLSGYLKSQGVNHYMELVGKDIKISKTQENSDGVAFLTF